MKHKSLLAGIILATSSSVALADQFYIDVGVDFGGNANTAAGDTTTGWLNEMLYEYSSETLVTDSDGNGPDSGDAIVTTGGFKSGAFGSAEVNTNSVSSFSPQQFGPTGPSDNGYGDWGLTFQFEVSGTLGPDLTTNYNNGSITFYYYDFLAGVPANTSEFKELFTLDVLSTTQSFGGPALRTMLASYGADMVNGVPSGDVFNFDKGTMTELVDNMMQVFASVDFNTDPTQIDIVNNMDGTYTLSGEHDGSISFQIPEPSSLAILGLGLLGLGGAARRRKS